MPIKVIKSLFNFCVCYKTLKQKFIYLLILFYFFIGRSISISVLKINKNLILQHFIFEFLKFPHKLFNLNFKKKVDKVCLEFTPRLTDMPRIKNWDPTYNTSYNTSNCLLRFMTRRLILLNISITLTENIKFLHQKYDVCQVKQSNLYQNINCWESNDKHCFTLV